MIILGTRDEGRYKKITRDAVILCCATFPVCSSILILIKPFLFPFSECHHFKDIAAQSDVGGTRICSLHPFPD